MHRISHIKVEPISQNYRRGSVNDDVLDLPPFNRWGYLPDGIHDACFEEVIQRFTTNSVRKTLCQRLQKFLLLAIDSKSFSYAYISGEFTTSKAFPRDIDVILQTQANHGHEAFQAMEPFLNMGLEAISRKYSVHLHFWWEGATEEGADFRRYFQYVRPQDAHLLGMAPGVKRGIVRIRL